jgi:hypothetical protein
VVPAVGGIEQQWRSVTAATSREHDLGAQAHGSGALKLVQWAGSCNTQGSSAAAYAPD